MMWIIFTILTVTSAMLHILIAKTPVIYTFLLYPKGSPFQYEVACANLSYGIMDTSNNIS
jgi:hypothetical protein